jgi:hypothetical protein
MVSCISFVASKSLRSMLKTRLFIFSNARNSGSASGPAVNGYFLLRVVPQSLWPYEPLTHSYFDTWRHNKISKARRSSKTFDLQPFFTKHISFTWQPQKSL